MLCPKCHKIMTVQSFCDTCKYKETIYRCSICGYSHTENMKRLVQISLLMARFAFN